MTKSIKQMRLDLEKALEDWQVEKMKSPIMRAISKVEVYTIDREYEGKDD